MNLIERLQQLNSEKGLTQETKLIVKFKDGKEMIGFYFGCTSALDNEPEIASLDLYSEENYYELYENEIESINLI